MRLGSYYRYILFKRLNFFAKIKKKHKILDIGGYDGYILSQLKIDNMVLIDPNAKKEYENIKYIKKDFFKHNFKKEKFDVIISFDVLEHISKNKEKEYLKKIYFLLEKKGFAIISVPSKALKIFPPFLTNIVHKMWGHFKCCGYSKEEIENLIRKVKITKYKIYNIFSQTFLNFFLLLRILKIFFPNEFVKYILEKIAEKDIKIIKMNPTNTSYFVIILRK